MRLAYFGGSFDPPHRGHLRIARAAASRLALDRILLAPTGRQPLKSHHLAPYSSRLHMVRLLCAADPRLTPSDADAPLPDHPNYTVDTLARLRPSLPPGAELFFLAGADSFLTLHHWREAQALLRLATDDGLLDGWILAARPGFPLAALPDALPPGYSVSDENQAPGPGLTLRLRDPQGRPATPLHLLPDLDDPSAATAIRQALSAGEPPPHLTDEVARYIREQRLYR